MLRSSVNARTFLHYFPIKSAFIGLILLLSVSGCSLEKVDITSTARRMPAEISEAREYRGRGLELLREGAISEGVEQLTFAVQALEWAIAKFRMRGGARLAERAEYHLALTLTSLGSAYRMAGHPTAAIMAYERAAA